MPFSPLHLQGTQLLDKLTGDSVATAHIIDMDETQVRLGC